MVTDEPDVGYLLGIASSTGMFSSAPRIRRLNSAWSGVVAPSVLIVEAISNEDVPGGIPGAGGETEVDIVVDVNSEEFGSPFSPPIILIRR